MEESPLLQPNLLTIYPGSIIIENFIPGRVYRDSLTIFNTSTIPIIFTIRASDKSKLILNKSLLRIEVNDSQKVDLVIQDKINYSSKKLPTKPKKLYIYLNGELIEEKYEITLMYFCNNNTINNFGINMNNIEVPNIKCKEVPSYYLTSYQKLEMKTNRTLVIDKTCNIFIRRFETNEVNALKNKINNLIQQISYLKQNIGKMGPGKINIQNDLRNLSKSSNSLFIMSNKLDDPQGKYKIDNDVEKNVVIAKNKTLQIENSILSKRIKILEEKLSKYEDIEEKTDFKEYNDNNSKDNNYYWENNIKNNNDKKIYNDDNDDYEYNEQIDNEDFQYQDRNNFDINDYQNFGNDE